MYMYLLSGTFELIMTWNYHGEEGFTHWTRGIYDYFRGSHGWLVLFRTTVMKLTQIEGSCTYSKYCVDDRHVHGVSCTCVSLHGYTAKKRWLFQPWVGLQALKHKVTILFLHYNSRVMSCILCLTSIFFLGCVYRVHVSRVMGDVTCAWNMMVNNIPLIYSAMSCSMNLWLPLLSGLIT